MSQAPLPFAPGAASTKISGSTSSSATAVNPKTGSASGCPQLLVYNAGSVIVYIEFGDSTVVAVKDTSMAVPAGVQKVFTMGRKQYIGVITDSSTAAVYVTPGFGGI